MNVMDGHAGYQHQEFQKLSQQIGKMPTNQESGNTVKIMQYNCEQQNKYYLHLPNTTDMCLFFVTHECHLSWTKQTCASEAQQHFAINASQQQQQQEYTRMHRCRK
jgi:hypothetical protein